MIKRYKEFSLLKILLGVLLIATSLFLFWRSFLLWSTLTPVEEWAIHVSAAQTPIIEENEHGPENEITERIEISNIEAPDFAQTGQQKPRILIYHTHTYEAYAQNEEDPYKPAYSSSTQWRTMDENYNIVRVGEELAELLRQMGFEVVHDTTAFEPPRLGTAYVRSLEMLNDRLAAHEHYDLVIDMHRDSYSESFWNPSSVTIDGQSCARLMFLIGTGENGFDIKPDWENNYAVALLLHDALVEIDEALCCPIKVKTERYNQHAYANSILIEVGHCENSLDEALASMRHLAGAIDSLFTPA